MIPLETITSIYTALVNLLAHIDKDAINGTFELAAGAFVLNHCRRLYRDKILRGVSLVSVAFFTVWGIWNLYYYPALGQSVSFYGAMLVLVSNAIYLSMAMHYRQMENLALIFDEHELYLGAESARCVTRTGDQA